MATCATCKHWDVTDEESRAYYVSHLWAAECLAKGHIVSMVTFYVKGDGFVDSYDLTTPPDFGCIFHQPAEARS